MNRLRLQGRAGRVSGIALFVAVALFALPAAAAAAPGAPTGLTITPASPANDNSPVLTGTADGGTTVSVFTTGDCTGTPVDVDAATFGTTGVTFTVGNNSTTTFSALATDATPESGPCSAPITYVEDSSGPPAPIGLSTTPTSPANNTTPLLKGTPSFEAGSTVAVFANGTCSGAPENSGSPATFASPGLPVSVTANFPTPLSARSTDALGNAGPCSASITYTEDSIAPGAPSGLTTTPASPSNINNVVLNGAAEAGSTVTAFKTLNCTGTPFGLGTAAAFASTGFPFTVANNSVTLLSAYATDAAGNTGPCSNSISYAEDSMPPPAPGLTTSPISPANENAPRFKGTAETGSTVAVFTNGSCSGTAFNGGTAAVFASSGFTFIVANNSTTTLSARVTDLAGNSTCSSPLAYVEDSNLPVRPQLRVAPASGANNNDPVVKGESEAGTTVFLFRLDNCAGQPVASGTSTAFAAGFSYHVNDNTTTTFSARAVKSLSGLASSCSDPLTYQEVSSGTLAKKCKKKKKSKAKSAATAKQKKKKHCKKKHKKKKK